MRLMGDKTKKSRVGVSIWDREGQQTSKGKKSMTFTVEDTTIEELAKFIQDAIRKASD